MKKLSAIMLALVMVLSVVLLASCKKEMTAYQTFSEAMAKTKALDSMELKSTATSAIAFGSEKLSMTVGYSVKTAGLKGDAPTLSGDFDIGVSGISMKANVYSTSDTIYVSMAGMKVKMDADSEDAQDYNVDVDDTLISNLPEDIFKDVEVIENDDKTKTINVTLTGEQFSEYCKDIYEKALEALDVDDVSMYDIKADDITISMVVNKDGYISKYTMNYKISVSVTQEGVTATATSENSVEIEFVNPGTPVTVDVPTDLDEYGSADDFYFFG